MGYIIEKKKVENDGKTNLRVLSVLLLYNTIVVLWPLFFFNVSLIKRYNVYAAMGSLILVAGYSVLKYGIKISQRSLLLPALFLIWLLITYIFNVDARVNLINPFYWLVIQCLPAYVLLYGIKDYKKLIEVFTKISYIVLLFYFVVYVLCEFSDIDINRMVVSYAMLPFILFVIQEMMNKVTLKNFLFFLGSSLVMLIKGCRGGLLCIVVLLILNLIVPANKKRNGVILLLAILLCAFMSSSYYSVAINKLNEFLLDNNIYSRTVTQLVEDEIQDDNGRSVYADAAIEGIKNSPPWGYGLCGDRSVLGEILVTKANYPHNVFLELVLQMGYVGVGFFVWMIYKVIYILTKVKDQYLKMFIFVLIPLSFVKLMLSSTYVAEIPFFMLLAILFSVSDRRIDEINKAVEEAGKEGENG